MKIIPTLLIIIAFFACSSQIDNSIKDTEEEKKEENVQAKDIFAVPQLPANYQFIHPGIINNKEEYDFIVSKVSEKKEPWFTAFKRLKENSVSDLNFNTTAYPVVFTNTNDSDFDGKTSGAEVTSARSAYAHALIWLIEKDDKHAEKSINIMNDWAYTLQKHEGHPNESLQAAWVAPLFVKAGEIIRHTYKGWEKKDQEQFEKMLTGIYLPYVEYGAPTTRAGNWELSFVEAMLAIAVFTENIEIFNRGLDILQKRIVNHYYLASDGPLPIMPEKREDFLYENWELKNFEKFKTESGIREYWYMNPGDNFYEGQCEETNRDFKHVQMGFAACMNALETALTQGIDMFTYNAPRIITSLEFHAKYMLGATVPFDLDNGTLTWTNQRHQSWEIANTRFCNNMGLPMPFSRQIVGENRQNQPNCLLHMCFETLTHADLPGIKL